MDYLSLISYKTRCYNLQNKIYTLLHFWLRQFTYNKMHIFYVHSSVNFNICIHLCNCCQSMMQNISIMLETALVLLSKQSGNPFAVFSQI